MELEAALAELARLKQENAQLQDTIVEASNGAWQGRTGERANCAGAGIVGQKC